MRCYDDIFFIYTLYIFDYFVSIVEPYYTDYAKDYKVSQVSVALKMPLAALSLIRTSILDSLQWGMFWTPVRSIRITIITLPPSHTKSFHEQISILLNTRNIVNSNRTQFSCNFRFLKHTYIHNKIKNKLKIINFWNCWIFQ